LKFTDFWYVKYSKLIFENLLIYFKKVLINKYNKLLNKLELKFTGFLRNIIYLQKV